MAYQVNEGIGAVAGVPQFILDGLGSTGSVVVTPPTSTTTAVPIGLFVKDKDATMDFGVDWSEWLDGDTIRTSSWTVPTGLTQEVVSHSNGIAVIFISSGTDGETYTLLNRITTSAGRTDDRTISIRIHEK